jgi:hypothetical protein
MIAFYDICVVICKRSKKYAITCIPWSKSGKQVVGVHHDMDEGVEKSKEGGVAAGKESCSWPTRERH